MSHPHAGCAGRRRGVPHPQPCQARPRLRCTGLAFLRLRAGLGADFPGQALQVGVLGEQRGHGRGFWDSPGRHNTRPPRHATLTTLPDRPRRKPRVRGRRQPSAEPPARGARLARPGSAGRDARGGAQSIVGPGLPWPPASSLGRGWRRCRDFPAAAPHPRHGAAYTVGAHYPGATGPIGRGSALWGPRSEAGPGESGSARKHRAPSRCRAGCKGGRCQR